MNKDFGRKEGKMIPVLATNIVLTRFLENMDKMMDTSKLNYSPAFVYEKQGYFRIIFYWRQATDLPLRRFRKSYGINRISDIRARKESANVLALSITKLLKQGWNPETNSLPEAKQTTVPKESIYLPLLLEKAHKNILSKSDKPRTHSSYNSHFRMFTEYLIKNKRYKISGSEFTRMDAIDYQNFLIGKGFAGKTINTKTDFASGLFRWIKKAGLINDNPFDALDKMKEKESERNQIFTAQELASIKDYCLERIPELWQYALFIYYCSMRPASIMAIKVKDIDLVNGWLYISAKDHKNNKAAQKQLLGAHLKYLAPYVSGLKPDSFLFSKQLKPGEKKMPATRAAELWREHIIEGLKISKVAYGLKNTFGANFLQKNNGNENLKWLQMQMSHADLQTTSIYTNKMKVIRLPDGQEPEI